MHALNRQPNRREAGSAYITTLLILVVLALLGLSLVFVTTGELQIGANERLINRAFYAGDSGIAISTVRILVSNDFAPSQLDLKNSLDSTVLNMANRVETDRTIPLFDAPCNLCSLNNAGTGIYNEKTYRKLAFAVDSQGQRVVGTTNEVVAEKAVDSMLEVQPWQGSIDSYLQIYAENQASTP